MTARRALGCPWSVLAPWVLLCSMCISCSVPHIFIVSLLRAWHRPWSRVGSCELWQRSPPLCTPPALPLAAWPPPSHPADQHPALLGQGAPLCPALGGGKEEGAQLPLPSGLLPWGFVRLRWRGCGPR